MAYEFVLGAVHENGLSVEFTIIDASNGDDDYVEVRGWLKWDGCVNWQTEDNCLAHFCGPESLTEFSAAMLEVWRQGGAALGDKYDASAPRP